MQLITMISKWLSCFKPKCSIWLNWSGPSCGKPAIARNRFGGFECNWHHSLPLNTQPDHYFAPGVLVRPIGPESWLRLRVAYLVRSLLSIELWKKR